MSTSPPRLCVRIERWAYAARVNGSTQYLAAANISRFVQVAAPAHGSAALPPRKGLPWPAAAAPAATPRGTPSADCRQGSLRRSSSAFSTAARTASAASSTRSFPCFTALCGCEEARRERSAAQAARGVRPRHHRCVRGLNKADDHSHLLAAFGARVARCQLRTS